MSNTAVLKKRAGALHEILRLSFKFQLDSEEAVTYQYMYSKELHRIRMQFEVLALQVMGSERWKTNCVKCA